jgi:hypothetical protein
MSAGSARLGACATALAVAVQVVSAQPVKFRNVARAAGTEFVVENHPTERKHLVETMAGGVAAFDYDGDGLTDIYFTNGASLPSLEKNDPKYRNRLYRNEGGMKFREVTKEAGLEGTGYSIAAAAADFDNDGDTDLFVGGVRENRLYRNDGKGRFSDVTAAAAIASGLWCEGAVWFDYDRDGKLDLFVVNYLQWTPEFNTYCGSEQRGIRAYCHPKLFKGLPNTLYRNKGDGTFEDVSKSSGIAAHTGKGMSASIADYDRDGHMDIFVTNDKVPNFLFRNKGDRTFEEVALMVGPAMRDSGQEISSMGADFRDYNNDGLPDIAFTALAGETFPLFLNTGKGMFRDAGQISAMAPLSHRRSGWSIGLVDLDNDGLKDIFTTNAHVNDTVASFEAAEYKLTNSVFVNAGNGVFKDATAGSGLEAEEPRAHRGCAFADFNRDGRIDAVVASLQGAAELWENVTPGGNSWLILQLRGKKSNRDGIGAEVRIGNQLNHMTSSVGYVSSSHFGVHFGTGKLARVEKVEIRWPSGTVQVLEGVETNRVLEVEEP